MKHFSSPQNIGEMEDADSTADVLHTGGGCLDKIRIFVKRNGDKVSKINYQCRACSGTIAACSAMSEMVVGMSLTDAGQFQGNQIAEFLGGVPDKKQHSVDLAAEALRNAIDNLTETS
ncbi:iron-sulfur cluster assembly scaffold protein [bacterium]|nr:iron-sulfur cluster assembly scaffold protein [bacterium]MBU1652200.1 iron-sulfur cluster assembly scaffold protein [bacterium]